MAIFDEQVRAVVDSINQPFHLELKLFPQAKDLKYPHSSAIGVKTLLVLLLKLRMEF